MGAETISITGAMLFLLPLLAVVSYVDLREMRIPDTANALLLAGGVSFWALVEPGALYLQVGSAVIAFAALWAVRAVHMRIAGRTGLGLGDVKMIGACAIWFHPTLFPVFLLVASMAAIAGILVTQRASGSALQTMRMPFAPFLSLGLLVTWFLEIGSL